MKHLRLVLLGLLAALVMAGLTSWHTGGDALQVPDEASSGSGAAQTCSVTRSAGGSDTGGGSALMVPVSLDQMTDESALILTGTVQSLRSCLSKDGRSIITEVVLATERHLKAPGRPPAPGTKVTILVPGGRFGDFRLVVGTSPQFGVGERVVVFLRQVEGQGLRLTEGFQSKFSLRSGDLVERASLSLSEFEAKVRQAIDGTIAPREDPLFQPGLDVVEQPFVTSGFTWPASSIPVGYSVNPITGRPAQLTAQESRDAANNAYNTWEAVPGSFIAFNSLGDTTRVSGADVCGPGPPDFFNDITWGIANPAHSSSTLAVTISCFSGQTLLDADIESDIDHFGATWRVDGSGACASDLFDLETVVLHEEGHFLGLAHPTSNVCTPGTNGACPVMNSSYGGVQRALCGDDIDGATALYPSSPIDCDDLPSPLPIPDDDPTGVTNTINLADTETITDLNVCLDVSHTWVGDLIVSLTHVATGTSVTLIDQPGVPASTFGCGSDDILAILDDEASSPVEAECAVSPPATIFGSFTPNNPLSAFDGESAAGDWTLNVSDIEATFAGTLNGWSLLTVTATPTASGTAVVPAGQKVIIATDPAFTANSTCLATLQDYPGSIANVRYCGLGESSNAPLTPPNFYIVLTEGPTSATPVGFQIFTPGTGTAIVPAGQKVIILSDPAFTANSICLATLQDYPGSIANVRYCGLGGHSNAPLTPPNFYIVLTEGPVSNTTVAFQIFTP